MFVKFLIYLILIDQILTCSTECLKCSENKTCLLCNFKRNFYLIDGICQQKTYDNCQQMDFKGNCLLCVKNYFFSNSAQKCLKVELKNIVNNCFLYDLSQNCQYCEKNFFLKNKNCLSVKTIISNCIQYLSEGVCLECDNNYYLSISNDSCIEFPQISNCLDFSNKLCDQCQNGYKKDVNLYLRKIIENFSLNENQAFFQILDQTFSNFQKISDQDNCLKTEQNQNQIDCPQNNFLTNEGKCEEIPIQPIQNCEEYFNHQNCSKCFQGYILENNFCFKISEEMNIKNCVKYSQIHSEVLCEFCEEQFYLSNNFCYQRDNYPISNCQEYHPLKSLCQTCKKNFILTFNKKNCFQQQENCLKHIYEETITAQLYCIECVEEYYLKNNKCVKGEIENCLIYSSNNSTCQICKNKYYLKNNQCILHKEIQNCNVYSQYEENYCLSCQENFISIKFINSCLEKQIIENCVYYTTVSDERICQKCEKGFYLENGKCQKIQIEFCEELSSNNLKICLKCQKDYKIAQYEENNMQMTKCLSVFFIVKERCQNFNENQQSIEDFSCEYCKDSAIPVNVLKKSMCIEQNYFQFLFPIFTPNQNCSIYRNNNCFKCSYKNLLLKETSQNYCIDCLSPNSLVLSQIICENEKCQFQPQTHCEEFLSIPTDFKVPSINPNNIGKEIFIKCEFFITEVYQDWKSISDYSNINPKFISDNFLVQNFMNVFPAVNCPVFQPNMKINENFYQIKPTLNPECVYYMQLAHNEFICIKCVHGKAKKASNPEFFISECESIANCQSEIIYLNIPPVWDQYLTCHKCKDENQIPVLAIFPTINEFGKLVGLFPRFSKDSFVWIEAIQRFTQPIFCMKNDTMDSIKTELDIRKNLLINFIPFCGMYLLQLQYIYFDNSDFQGNPETTFSNKQTLLCGFCKPGYKAGEFIGNKNVPFVSSCSLILNCQESLWVNACSKCKTGFAYGFDQSNQKILFDECVAVSENLTNCYVFDSVLNKCLICQEGYTLFKNQCVLFQLSKCIFQSFSHLSELALLPVNINFGIYMQERSLGCFECQSGFLPLIYEKNSFDKICLQGKFQKNDQMILFSNQIIDNCEQFSQITNILEYLCEKCQIGFILRNQKKNCVEKNLVPNCLLSHNSLNICVFCEKNYFLDQEGFCQQKLIDHCEEYYQEIYSPEILCKKCQEQYYYEKSQCAKGKIYNCQIYLNKFECLKCFLGFDLLKKQTTGMSHDLCLLQNEKIKCLNGHYLLESENFSQICDSCGILQYQIVQNISSLCINLVAIEFCKIYQLNYLIGQNIIECKECEKNYFYNQTEKNCSLRIALDENCEKYFLNKDKCEKCIKDFFLDSVSKKCLENPKGIFNCEIYINKKICKFCFTGYYLKENACEKVKLKSLIKNCLFYSSETNCQQCEANYLLKQNECNLITISNCVEFQNFDSCEKCQEGFVLETKNLKSNCIKFIKENCIKLSQIFPYDCLTCQSPYFPGKNGECIESELKIENCENYNGNNQCFYCKKNYILSSSRTQCTFNDIFPNCQIFVFLDEMKCSKCKIGYYLDQNICEEVIVAKQQGCISVDNNNECLICHFDYYMKEVGVCFRINPDEQIKTINLERIFSFSYFSYYLLSMFFDL